MSIRNVLRGIVGAMGLIQLLAFFLGKSDTGALFISGMLFFLAATNFCKECPIIFFARRAYWKMRTRKIPTQKL